MSARRINIVALAAAALSGCLVGVLITAAAWWLA